MAKKQAAAQAEGAAIPEAPIPDTAEAVDGVADTADAVDTAERIKARVLVDGPWGRINEVAHVTAEELATAVPAGALDPHPDAVAYAESLAST